MKEFLLFYFLILNLLKTAFLIIPLWNFESSTYDLLSSSSSNSITYEIYSKNDGGINIKIEKTISRNEDTITEKNIIYIGGYNAETSWEDIESVYYIDRIIYICPKGKNHMNKFESNTFTEIKSSSFSYDEDWELQCYYQPNKNYIFVGYLNKYSKFSAYIIDSNSWNDNTNIYNGLFDFKWTTQIIDDNNRDYPMKMLVYNDNKIILKGSKFTLESSNINRNDISSQVVIDALSYSNAFFNIDNDYFYFITYDKDPPDFNSGYNNQNDDIDYSNLRSITISTNSDSPLEFFYDFTIQNMHFAKNTKYVFYEIYNTIKNKSYYGIIDIVLNKIIFNTDKVINSFRLYTSDSFLAMTRTSVYKICALSENDECISSCSSGSIYIDSQRPNFCGNECSHFILVPTEICIDECDENIFHTEDNYHCGFCKDINESYPYKLLNTSGCLNRIPEGTYLYNSKYNLLKISTNITERDLCNKNADLYPVNYGNYTKNIKCLNKNEINQRLYFDSENEEFRPCFETCLTCSKEGNKSFHNCILCESGYRLKPEESPKNNCVADCPFYYYNEYKQYKCVENLPCPKEAILLIKEKNKCINDCKNDNTYKYQYNGFCYKECPGGTKNNNNICEDEKKEVFTLTQNNININYTSFIDKIDNFVQSYSNEFSYTNNHVSEYINEEYEAIIYKDKNCINELSLNFPSVDFGNCYDKIQNKSNITEDLIVVIINKIDENNNRISSYSLFNPKTGVKLNADICKNDTILVSKNILSLLNENLTNYELMLSLIKQGVNIFNSSDKFYKDLCFDYNLENEKDIAFQDRLKLFYPNISLCDSECKPVVNLENNTVSCECYFNDISSTNNISFLKDNVFIENLLGDAIDFIESSNIDVSKCAKKAIKYFTNVYGFYITLGLLSINIVLSILFYFVDLKKIKLYIFKKTQNYLKLLGYSININNGPPSKKNKKEENNNNRNETEGNTKKKDKNNKKKNIKKEVKIKNNKIENLNIMISINNKSSQRVLKSEGKLFQNEFNKKNNNFETYFFKFGNTKKNESDIKKYKSYFEEYLSSSDEMEYDDAIKKDKRKFCQYFCDNLKDNQIVYNTFFIYEPFKPRTIKIILFILNLLLFFVINALFINDDYISETYNLKGKENFFNFISRSINRFFYTTVICMLIEFVVDFFFIKETKMKRIFLREKDNKYDLEEQIIALLKRIKYSYLAFIIFVYIIFIVCLYYLICFNSIYPHIQMEWIISSIIIFFMRQILSVLQCLFETILRFISFSLKSEKIFKVSKLIN